MVRITCLAILAAYAVLSSRSMCNYQNQTVATLCRRHVTCKVLRLMQALLLISTNVEVHASNIPC